jgi:DNA-binding GntR family transcriptional regulator
MVVSKLAFFAYSLGYKVEDWNTMSTTIKSGSEKLLLRQAVYDHVLDYILTGRLSPGEKVLEEKLSSELSVSRTPIREALRLLESDGYVQVSARRGAVVASISRDDVKNVYQLVGALEGYAVLCATKSLTAAQIDQLSQQNGRISKIVQKGDHVRFFELNRVFHATMFSACGNPLILDQIEKFRNRIARFRILSLSVPGRMLRSAEEHDEIVEAIRARDPGAARALQEQHVLRGGEVVLQALDSMFSPSQARSR